MKDNAYSMRMAHFKYRMNHSYSLNKPISEIISKYS